MCICGSHGGPPNTRVANRTELDGMQMGNRVMLGSDENGFCVMQRRAHMLGICDSLCPVNRKYTEPETYAWDVISISGPNRERYDRSLPVNVWTLGLDAWAA